MITPEGAVLDEPSEIVRLGKRNFRSVIYCVNPFAGDLPITVQPYVDQIIRSDFSLSGDMFIRRFTEASPGLDGRRFDLIYLHDIARQGYQCDDIGDDLFNPDEAIADELYGWKARAERSFEIIG